MVIIGFETFPHSSGVVPGVLKTDGFLRVHDKGIYIYICTYIWACHSLSENWGYSHLWPTYGHLMGKIMIIHWNWRSLFSGKAIFVSGNEIISYDEILAFHQEKIRYHIYRVGGGFMCFFCKQKQLQASLVTFQ